MGASKAVIGLLGLIAIELAVLDYVALQASMNGLEVEVTQQELMKAEEQAMVDIENEFNQGSAE